MNNRALKVGIGTLAVAASVGAFWLDWRAALLMAAANLLDRIFTRAVARDSGRHPKGENAAGG